MRSHDIMAGYRPPGEGLGGAFAPDVFVCPQCFTSYDDPVTLQCGHTFCKHCLIQRTDGNLLKCPSCMRLIDLGDHGMEGLQGTYLINNILKLVSMPDDSDHNSQAATSRPPWPTKSHTNIPYCQSCHSDITSSKFCTTCKEYLCNNCTSAHQRSIGLASEHQIIPLSSPPAPGQLPFCAKHQHELLEFCCNLCVKAVCRECILNEHRGHAIVGSHESAQEFKQLMPTIVNDLKCKTESVNNVITQVERVLDSVESKAKSVSSEVRTCIRTSITALEDKERDLLNQVENIRKLKCELLLRQREDLNRVKTQLGDAASLVLNAYSTLNDGELINIRQCLQNNINQIQGEMGQLTMCHEDDSIDFVMRDHGIKSSISQIGAVTSGISPVHTTASGQGINCAIIGKYAKFCVTCRNHSNQKVSQSREPLDVNLYAPDGNQIKVEMTTKPDSTYQFSYYPTTIGAYTISIRVRGRHITGSPMTSRVRKRRNYFNIGASDHQIGTDGEEDGQLCRPWGICCDPKGHIIVADRSNNRIQVFNGDGTYMFKFGETGSAPGQFNRPAGVTVNSHNHVVVADKDNHRVQVFTFDGKFLHCFGERGSLNGQLHYPWDVACNIEDCILVSDTRNHRIQLYSPTGQYLNKFNFHSPPHQRMQLPQPRGVCFTESGDILVTDFNKHRLMFIRSNFQTIQMFGSEGQGNGQFFRPQGVAVDLEGNIIVSEGRNNRVQIFRPDGSFLSKFGTLGSGSSEFDRPSGISVTPDGYIVVVDFGNNRIMFF